MKQILYNIDNVKKIYLCVYANAYISERALSLVNTLTNVQITVRSDEEHIHKLWNNISAGVEEELLISILTEMGIENIYEVWIQEGMIE